MNCPLSVFNKNSTLKGHRKCMLLIKNVCSCLLLSKPSLCRIGPQAFRCFASVLLCFDLWHDSLICDMTHWYVLRFCVALFCLCGRAILWLEYSWDPLEYSWDPLEYSWDPLEYSWDPGFWKESSCWTHPCNTLSVLAHALKWKLCLYFALSMTTSLWQLTFMYINILYTYIYKYVYE